MGFTIHQKTHSYKTFWNQTSDIVQLLGWWVERISTKNAKLRRKLFGLSTSKNQRLDGPKLCSWGWTGPPLRWFPPLRCPPEGKEYENFPDSDTSMWQINAQGSRFFRHVQRRHVQLKKLDLGMNLSPWFSQDSHGCFPKQNHGWFSLLLHHFAWRVMGKPCEFSFIGVNVAQFQCRTLPALFECPKSATCSMSSLLKMRLPSLTALTPAKRSIIWVNYNDLTATSLESWLIREIIPKWP